MYNNYCDYDEKIIDMTQPGAEYDLRASLAYGWRIKSEGLTCIILCIGEEPKRRKRRVNNE